MFKKKDKKKNQESDKKEEAKPPRQIVVIDGDELHDWVEFFKGVTFPDGRGVRVVQASWIEVEVTVYDTTTLMTIAPVRESDGKVKRPNTLSITPDFILIRNQVRGPTPESDRRNILFGLMESGIPSINTLESEYMNLERSIMFGALKEIKKRLGHDQFPLISQNFYSSHRMMVIAPEYPFILKVSHAHAGMGKIQIKDSTEFRDISTVLALHKDYCTGEPYIEPEYGIRVQKLGNSYRVYKKVFTGSGWKSQFGGADLQEVPLTDNWKLWADECSKCFGGMDILAVDAIHGRDGKDYIIELNGTAIGLHRNNFNADSLIIRDMVLEKMNKIYYPVNNVTSG